MGLLQDYLLAQNDVKQQWAIKLCTFDAKLRRWIKKGRRHEAEPGKEESDKRWQPEHPIKPLKRLTATRNEPTDEFVNIRSHTYIKGAAGLRLVVVVVIVLTKIQIDGPADRQSQTDSQSNSDGKLARVEMLYKWHICAPQHSGRISKHGNNWSQIFNIILSIERSVVSQY